MNFAIGQVPIPRPVQPLQQPKRYDPADVIMQAAQIQQQRQLRQQQMLQESFQNMMRAFQAGAELQEKKRASQAHEDIAQRTIEIAEGKLPLEKAEMAARAKYLESQANMMSSMGSDVGKKLFQMALPGPNGQSPQMSFEQAASLLPRGAQKIPFTLGALQALNQGQGTFMTGTAQLAGQRQAAVTQQSPAIQMPLRLGQTLLPQLNLLDHLADKLPRTDLQWLNKGGIQLMKSNGSVVGQAVATQLNNFVQGYNQQFGRGSDKKLDSDFDALSSAQSPAQLKLSLALTKSDMITKINSLSQKPLDYIDPTYSIVAPLPKFSKKDYLTSLGADYSSVEAMHSLQTARDAGLISD